VSEPTSRSHAWALRALAHYHLVDPIVTFIRHNENITFRVVEGDSSAAYLLRLHKPHSGHDHDMRQRPEVVASELLWLDALHRDTLLTVQQPVRNARGDLVTNLDADGEPVPCTLLRWLEGDEFRQESPDAVALAAHLGAVVAALHDHATHWRRPEGFVRPIYDVAFFQRQVALLARGVEAGVIASDDYAALQDIVAAILSLLGPVLAGPHRWGLIHNDLQGSNILAWWDEVRPIDFSLCGFGSCLSDLGTTLPSLTPELRHQFLAGYRDHRRLDDADLRLVDGFFLLSRLGAYVFMQPDPAHHAWLRNRVPRFVARECRAFLRGRPILFV
jgi:Ser/Thr protein kinase RdoA (MazF antagonist)